MNFLQNIWDSNEGHIWFRALLSLIVITFLGVWVYVCIHSKTLVPFDSSHTILILGGLGLTAYAQNSSTPTTNVLPTTNSVPAPAPVAVSVPIS